MPPEYIHDFVFVPAGVDLAHLVAAEAVAAAR
jgi:hypothetical protein